MTEAPQQPFSKRKACRMVLKPGGNWNVDFVVGDDFNLPHFITSVRGSGVFISPDLGVCIPYENILFFAIVELDAAPTGQIVQFQTVKGGLADLKPEGVA